MPPNVSLKAHVNNDPVSGPPDRRASRSTAKKRGKEAAHMRLRRVKPLKHLFDLFTESTVDWTEQRRVDSYSDTAEGTSETTTIRWLHKDYIQINTFKLIVGTNEEHEGYYYGLPSIVQDKVNLKDCPNFPAKTLLMVENEMFMRDKTAFTVSAEGSRSFG